MPEGHDGLSGNLEFVLRSLERCGDRIQDTILLFHAAGKQFAFTNQQGFSCITMSLDMIAGGNFVLIKGIPLVTPFLITDN